MEHKRTRLRRLRFSSLVRSSWFNRDYEHRAASERRGVRRDNPHVLLQEAKDIFIYQGEENAKYEAMAAAIPPPSKPISAQVQEIEQQTLDIANAVTSLYETMLVAGVNV